MALSESELILNSDGSVYHLNLLPGEVAETIITVGDPERVSQVSKHFDSIEVKKGKREFLCHTGHLGKKRLSVISTGIGTDNIDIVFNELDALFNIEFISKKVKKATTQLQFLRIGTSGSIQKDIGVDSYLVSETAIGLEGLLHFYKPKNSAYHKEFLNHLAKHLNWGEQHIHPYICAADESLFRNFSSAQTISGYTVTNAGFYGPQGRGLRLQPQLTDFFEKLQSFSFKGKRITNLEMETSGIYGISQLLGHQAISLNAILANRASGTFSKNPQKTTDGLIIYTLERLEGLSS